MSETTPPPGEQTTLDTFRDPDAPGDATGSDDGAPTIDAPAGDGVVVSEAELQAMIDARVEQRVAEAQQRRERERATPPANWGFQ